MEKNVKKMLLGLALMFSFTSILIPQPTEAQQGGMMHENWEWVQMGPKQLLRMQRHWTYMNQGAPATYHNASSTVRATPENVAAGARLYGEYCANCHGRDGRGRGRSPGLQNYLVQTPEARDDNLLRLISKGSRRMPAFKSKLQDDEIWQIIDYMRSVFPSVNSD
jgi:mono/diheme cytochrome c family protein